MDLIIKNLKIKEDLIELKKAKVMRFNKKSTVIKDKDYYNYPIIINGNEGVEVYDNDRVTKYLIKLSNKKGFVVHKEEVVTLKGDFLFVNASK